VLPLTVLFKYVHSAVVYQEKGQYAVTDFQFLKIIQSNQDGGMSYMKLVTLDSFAIVFIRLFPDTLQQSGHT